jgi:hypothetical protein
MLIKTMKVPFVTFLSLIVSCRGFAASSQYYKGHESRNILKASAGNAIDLLDQSQLQTMKKITASIPSLIVQPELSWPADACFAGCSGRLTGYEAPGADGNVAWMSSVFLTDKLSSLTIFNGPLTNVPHLLSRCCILNDNTMAFTLDFRPRAYGAYDKRDAVGNYPGPDELGRAAFEYSGNRMEFDTKFGTPEVVNFIQSTIASFQGASPQNRQLTELDVLTRGPLVIDVVMPLNDANIAAVASAREQAANFWLSWATSRQYDHRPGAPINSQYVYDTKYKQNAYGALLTLYSDLFGEVDGRQIAFSESGPLDEAYVGGGS